jgi:hypothetical protein
MPYLQFRFRRKTWLLLLLLLLSLAVLLLSPVVRQLVCWRAWLAGRWVLKLSCLVPLLGPNQKM